MVLKWSNDYLIGIDLIDEQHQALFMVAHRFRDEILLCREEESVEKTLAFLKNYAKKHFADEEVFMRKHEYPDVENHLKLHDTFLERYDELAEKCREVGPSQDLADEIAEMVQDWLIEHVAEADTDYAKHVKNRKMPADK